MTDLDGSWVLLASDHPRKGHATLHAVRPGLVLGTTAGEGESHNPKLSPNEDSAAVVTLAGGGVAMAVADAHFGPSASESAVQAFARVMRGARPPTAAELARVVADLDGAVRAGRSAEDASETTFLAATVSGRTLTWASVGDSLLYVQPPGGALERLSHAAGIFLGDRWDLSALRDAGESMLEGVLHAGSVTLPPGTVILLATDGIEEDFSGLSEPALSALLREDRPLAPKIETLLARGGRLPSGGRDNLTVVAVELAR